MQNAVIWICGGLAIALLVLSLLFRFVWDNQFWTKLCVALLGGFSLLSVILQFGRRRKR